jgi:hypothetical protein
MITALADMLRNFVPHDGQVSQIYSVLGLLPTDFIPILIKGLDSEVVKKLGEWATLFADDLNKIAWPKVSEKPAGEPTYADDFYAITEGTRYEGMRLNAEILEEKANEITRAIKAANFEEAVMAGLSLASGAFGA